MTMKHTNDDAARAWYGSLLNSDELPGAVRGARAAIRHAGLGNAARMLLARPWDGNEWDVLTDDERAVVRAMFTADSAPRVARGSTVRARSTNGRMVAYVVEDSRFGTFTAELDNDSFVTCMWNGREWYVADIAD